MPDPAYEQRDIHVCGVAYFLAGVVCGLGLVALLVMLLLHLLSGGSSIPAGFTANPTQQPSGPNGQSDQSLDLAHYRAEQTRLLTTAAWLDAEHATARLPIEMAMQLVLTHGAEAGPGAPTLAPQSPLQLQRIKASAPAVPTP